MPPGLQRPVAVSSDIMGISLSHFGHAGEGEIKFRDSMSSTEYSAIHQALLRALLYYDIWAHPLTAAELALFLPIPLERKGLLEDGLVEALHAGTVRSAEGYYFPGHRRDDVVSCRKEKERRARRFWTVARLSMHIIKRFPFVRAVLVSGELSKNVSSRGGDIDFFILTAPRRLWLTRSFLVLFKKIFLLNNKKFFCLNYFATDENLEETERNIYVAAEIAHVKPLHNAELYRRYLEANHWIATMLPNFDPTALPAPRVSERRSMFQWLFETVLAPFPLDAMDRRLQALWKRVWARRYSWLTREDLERAFTSTASISRAYAGDCQATILREYRRRLDSYGLA